MQGFILFEEKCSNELMLYNKNVCIIENWLTEQK